MYNDCLRERQAQLDSVACVMLDKQQHLIEQARKRGSMSYKARLLLSNAIPPGQYQAKSAAWLQYCHFARYSQFFLPPDCAKVYDADTNTYPYLMNLF